MLLGIGPAIHVVRRHHLFCGSIDAGLSVVVASTKRSSFSELRFLVCLPCMRRTNRLAVSRKVCTSWKASRPCKPSVFLVRAEYAVRFSSLYRALVVSHPDRACTAGKDLHAALPSLVLIW